MTTDTPNHVFDFSYFSLTSATVNKVHRSAERARSKFRAAKIKNGAERILAAYRSVGEAFSFAQRQNQAVSL